MSSQSTCMPDSLNVSHSRLPSPLPTLLCLHIPCNLLLPLSGDLCLCLSLRLSLPSPFFMPLCFSLSVPPVFPPCTPSPSHPPTSQMMDGQLAYFQSAISPDAVRGLDAAAGGRARRGMKGGVEREERSGEERGEDGVMQRTRYLENKQMKKNATTVAVL